MTCRMGHKHMRKRLATQIPKNQQSTASTDYPEAQAALNPSALLFMMSGIWLKMGVLRSTVGPVYEKYQDDNKDCH